MQKTNDIVDLNIRALTLLSHLFETQSVSRTGELLGLSQPATSRALAQLRILLGDPLVIRSGRGSALTARAESLAPKVAVALAALASVIEPDSFDPLRSSRTFRLATTDYGAAIVLPELLAILINQAPAVRFNVSSWNGGTIEAMANGQLDFAFYADGDLPLDFHTRRLFEDRQACLVKRSHPLVKRAGKRRQVSADDVVMFPQIVMSYPDGRISGTDELLGSLGQSSQFIPLQSPYFMLAPLTVAQTDAVACIPLRLANVLSTMAQTAVLEVKGSNTFSYRLIWHERIHRDKGFEWLRKKCTALF